MTHIVGFTEGYWEYFIKFMEYFHGRTYANGKAKVRARVMIPVHFGINECGKKEFLADLKSFSCGIEDIKLDKKSKKRKKNGIGAKKKMGLFIKIFRKIFPQIHDIREEMKNIKCNQLRQKEGKKGNHFMMSFYPVGEIFDDRYPDGTEVV